MHVCGYVPYIFLFLLIETYICDRNIYNFCLFIILCLFDLINLKEITKLINKTNVKLLNYIFLV